MLILIAGLPGSGKTTVADAFSKKYGAVHLNSDHVRKELGLWGKYGSGDKAQVYDELLKRTGKALADGATVVVDSTFFKAKLRSDYIELAENQGVTVKWVLATAPEAVLRQRVAVPRPDSEAGEPVLEKIRTQFEPLEPPFLTIDTASAPPAALADEIHAYLKHG